MPLYTACTICHEYCRVDSEESHKCASCNQHYCPEHLAFHEYFQKESGNFAIQFQCARGKTYTKYEGSWTQNWKQKHLGGILTWQNGDKVMQYYDNGELVSSKPFTPEELASHIVQEAIEKSDKIITDRLGAKEAELHAATLALQHKEQQFQAEKAQHFLELEKQRHELNELEISLGTEKNMLETVHDRALEQAKIDCHIYEAEAYSRFLEDIALEREQHKLELAKQQQELSQDRMVAQLEISEERDALQKEKEHFQKLIDDNQRRLLEAVNALKDPVTLNVGGMKFTTTKATLSAAHSTYFAGLVSGRFAEQPPDGYFIDRDGTYFSHILNFLRDQYLSPRLDEVALDALMREAQYYCIDSLQTAVMHIMQQQ